MKKILGLDLGSSSIGWAFIEENENSSKIKMLGVRVIPYTGDEKDQFSKGQAISVNKDRTLKRTARKTLHRYKLRRKNLLSFLAKNNMLPDSEKLLKIEPLQLYGIRAKAVTDKIELTDFGRILYHLNQKRGYKSSRSSSNDDDNGKKLSDYLSEMKDRKDLLEREHITIGQYFYTRLKENCHFRVKQNVFPRECYINEFNKIWDTQQKYYPEVLTEQNKAVVRDQIIFYQRRLKSQKGLVGECQFEKHHKVTPKSSPLFQVEKIWESIHTISITNKYKEAYTLSQEQRLQIFDYLDQHEKLTQTELFRMLKIKRTDGWFANEMIRKSGLQGNLTKTTLLKKLQELNIPHNELTRFELKITETEKPDKETGELLNRSIISPDFEKEPLYQIWHLLYSIDDPDLLINTLKKRYKVTTEQAAQLSNIDFKKSGFGNKSARAIRKILPYLINGSDYTQSCQATGYNHSNSLTKAENEQRILQTDLNLYKKNTLRQPVVEKILNQLINVVNAILKDENLGRPDEIRVELARELRQSQEERNKTYSNNIKADKDHKAIRERLEKEYPGLPVSRKVIEKFKLFEQQDGTCMYSGNKMELSKVLRGEGIDIDHIIPQSRLFDDSFQNKVLAYRKENEAKKDLTGYDYMKSKSDTEFRQYTERVSQMFENGNITRSKQTKLLMSVNEIPDDFISRQMNETRFISREATKLLKGIARDVYSTSGMVTDFLRNQWGYNEVLKQLNWSKYEAAGKIKDGKIEGWSKRDDHRHHAIDALVVACTRQSIIQRLNRLNSNQTREEMLDAIKGKVNEGWQAKKSLLEQHVQLLQPFSTQQVKEAVDQILISLKPGKKVATRGLNKADGKRPLTPRGQLHKEQVYGKIQRYSKKIPLTGRFTQVDKISDPRIQTLIRERLSAFNGDPKKAFKSLDKNPIWTDEAKTVPVTEVTIWEEHFVYKYPLGISFKEKDIEFIIDKRIQSLVRQRFEEKAGGKDHPLKNIENEPIWLDKKNGIAVKSVRCFTGLNDLVPLHVAENGFTKPKREVSENSIAVDFVSTRNNHHMAIYKSQEGKLFDNTVSLWEALERKKLKLPVIVENPKKTWDFVIDKGIDNKKILENLPSENSTFLYSMQQNELFVFDTTRDYVERAIQTNNYSLISSNIYRVQKMSKKANGSVDIYFRHHLETTVDDNKTGGELVSKELNKVLILKSINSLSARNPLKIVISSIGKISLV